MEKTYLSKKENFKAGLFWNYISLIFMAAGGFCFSLLIGVFYDAETLGYFNTFYALYIALAQLAVFGCQNAVTKYISESPEDLMRAKSYLMMSLIIIGGISVATNVLCRLPLIFIKNGIDLSMIEINAMLFGILMFAVNKAVLGFLNGLSRMSEFGIFQSFRYIFIAVFIILFSAMHLDREYLVLCFLCAETLLFLIEIPALLKGGFAGVKVTKCDLKEITVFGYHILPANLVLELNSKADVLCLSFITGNERMVGIYSFAVLFAEGFYQLFVVLRRSINPKITFNYVSGTFSDFYANMNRLFRRFGYLVSAVCGIIVVIVYRMACLIMKDASYVEGTASLIVVIVAIVINMRGIIWGNLLSQIGAPKYEAKVNLTTIITNVVMNFVFINLLGMIGAAIGTAVSYFVFSLVQKTFIKKELSI